MKIAMEERRLLLAQRNLESIRLIAELLARAKVRAEQGDWSCDVPAVSSPCMYVSNASTLFTSSEVSVFFITVLQNVTIPPSCDV